MIQQKSELRKSLYSLASNILDNIGLGNVVKINILCNYLSLSCKEWYQTKFYGGECTMQYKLFILSMEHLYYASRHLKCTILMLIL